MFHAYRSGKYPISEKAWRKLEAAERAAGIENGGPLAEVGASRDAAMRARQECRAYAERGPHSGEGAMEPSDLHTEHPGRSEVSQEVARRLAAGPSGAAEAMSDQELMEYIDEWWQKLKAEQNLRMRAARAETILAFLRELHRRDLLR